MASLAYHTLDADAYGEAVFNLLKLSEGDKLTAYVDTKGIPTIGIGFNLHDPTIYSLVIDATAPALTSDERDTLFNAIKGTYSSAKALNSVINSVLATFKSENPDAPSTLAFSSTDQTKDTFDQAKTIYEDRVDNWLPGVPESTERAVLVSLAYNGLINTGKSPSLRRSIVSGNRAEAWYEIRYDSNGGKDDLANRRYLEADKFGLYGDASKPSQSDALQAAQMYTDHRDAILDYEDDDNPSDAAASKKTPSIQDIYHELIPAISTLKDEYKIPSSFPIQEVLAASNKMPNLNGDGTSYDSASNEQDLLIGSNSNNNLSGGSGDDAIFGGGGNDTIDGGSGAGDTAFYSGNPSDYDIVLNKDNSWTISDVRGTPTDGVDTLKNVEFVQFSDGTKYSLTPNGIKDQRDFSFVVDTTGSMGPYIGAVQDDARALIASEFTGGNTDARIGVVSFKDPSEGDPNSVVLRFTDQTEFADRQAAAVAAIGTLGAEGGGDIPEADEGGLLLALNGSMGNWRPSAASREIVLFSDAPVKDTDLASTVNKYAHDQNDVVTSATASAPIAPGMALASFVLAPDAASTSDNSFQIDIYTIQVGSDASATSSLAKIAADNGGEFLAAPTPADLVSTLSSIISNTAPGSTLTDATITVDPGVTYNDGNFTITGNASSVTGIAGVEISALAGDARQDLGAATLEADGSFSFTDAVGSGTQSFIFTTLTDGSGGSVDADSHFDLTVGIRGMPYVARQDSYDPATSTFTGQTFFKADGSVLYADTYTDNGDGTADYTYSGGTYFDQRPYASFTDRYRLDGTLLSEIRTRNDGSHTISAEASGQTLASISDDTLNADSQPSTHFVFTPGYGNDTVLGFKSSGTGHDTLVLSSDNFASLIDVLNNTKNTANGAVITDPVSGDTIRIAGVSKAELARNKKDDFAFHT